MKKLFFGLIALFLLVGCSQNQQTTVFMLENDQKLSALYNSEGEKLTDYLYESYQKIDGIGYIVTNKDKQVGLISLEGEEIIKMGEYETLESVGQMFYATQKTEEEKKDDEEVKEEEVKNVFASENLYVLNDEGNVLYQAGDQTQIMKSGLPVIKQDQNYIVLYKNGEELYNGQDEVSYADEYSHGQSALIGFKDKNEYYYFADDEDKEDFHLTISKGQYEFLAQNNNGCVLNDAKTKSMVYVDILNKKFYQHEIVIKDAYFDDKENILLTADDVTYIYSVGNDPILINSYYYDAQTYLEREQSIYGPHNIYKSGKLIGTFEECQLYPQVRELYFEIFPVYVRDQGYVYYNFDNQKVIDQTYIEANTFDSCETAIVMASDKGYSLINNQGEILTKNIYYRMEYIGSSYYAVYNESGLYGIVDSTGEEIFPVEYTSLPETPIIEYGDEQYLMLNKNGRSYVYDINNDMKEVFSIEGDLTFHKEGYLSNGYHYYTIEGESIE